MIKRIVINLLPFAGRSVGRGAGCGAARAGCLLALMLTAACAPQFFPGGKRSGTPQIDTNTLVTADQAHLPWRIWPAEKQPAKAVIIALHGFNDYSRAFEKPAAWWAKSGLAVYAYDQRGFGAGPHPGYWSDAETMALDLRDAVIAVRKNHPQTSVYLLGSSMGAAVILAALGDDHIPSGDTISGVILVGPAVRGPSTLNPFLRFALWFGAHTVPANNLTGEGLKIKPSDNIPMLRALGRDPLVIKSTRVDTLYGLVLLMGNALEASQRLHHPALVLGAGDDQLVPGHAHEILLELLQGERTEAVYPNGYHMLLRDLQARVVWQDILAWIENHDAPLPSGLGRKIKSSRETVR